MPMMATGPSMDYTNLASQAGGPMSYPAMPGPALTGLLGQAGVQFPQHLQQTQLFRGLEQQHPELARSLNSAIMSGAMTPPQPQGPEGAGNAIGRMLQGVVGANQAGRQFQISQIMAPFQLAQQHTALQAAQSEEAARQAQIKELGGIGEYYHAMGQYTAPEARAYAAQQQLAGKQQQIDMQQQMLTEHNQTLNKQLDLKQQQIDNQLDIARGLLRWHMAAIGGQNGKKQADAFFKAQDTTNKNLVTAQTQLYHTQQEMQKLGPDAMFDEKAKDQYTKLQKDFDDAQKSVTMYQQQSEQLNQKLTKAMLYSSMSGGDPAPMLTGNMENPAGMLPNPMGGNIPIPQQPTPAGGGTTPKVTIAKDGSISIQ